MLKAEREETIIKLLAAADTGVMRVEALSKLLVVSEMTIRRDLEDLEQRGVVQRIHGGALLVNNTLLFEKSFRDRSRELYEQKVAIGKAAAGIVKDGNVVLIDAGTTTLQVATHIKARSITTVTNALPVATELAAHDGVSSILLGGNLKGPELCTVGPMVTEGLSRMTADILFLSISGFASEQGLTDPDLREAEVKGAMMKAAKRIILVADSSKFQVVRFAKVAPLTAVNMIITDSSLPLAGQQAITALGVELLIAESS